jgi:hypothetical protein
LLLSIDTIRRLNTRDLQALVESSAGSLEEASVIAVLENRACNDAVCGAIAQNTRFTSFQSVRVRLVAHSSTPHAHAVRLVYFLHWGDLVRLSTNVRISPVIRRAIDKQLMMRIPKLSTGEKVSIARRCTREVATPLLRDPTPRVLTAALQNPRLREEDVLALIAWDRTMSEQLSAIAGDRKWSLRYAIRKALVVSRATPRGIAASQLRHMTPGDLRNLAANPEVSVYLRRCIERQLGSAPTPDDAARGE